MASATLILVLEKANPMCSSQTPDDADRYFYQQSEFPIPIYYDFNPIRKVTLGTERECVKRAIDDYENKLNFKFFTLLEEGVVPEDLEKVLHMRDSRSKDECSKDFKDLEGVLASATFPPHKKMCIDSGLEWTEFMLKNVLIHELGHSLGLDHDNSRNHTSIMNAGYNDKIDGLQPADLLALKKYYPFL